MKEFTVSTEADREKPPIEFAISGTYARGYQARDGASTWREVFRAQAMPPMVAIDSLSNALITDPVTRKTQYNPASVLAFIRAVLVPDDVLRFDDLVQDRSRQAEMKGVAEVMNWLSEQYVGSPTGAPSSLTSGGAGIATGASGTLPSVASPDQ